MYREAEVLAELIRKCVEENAFTVLNQQEYQKRYNGYVSEYKKLESKISDLEKEKTERKQKEVLIGAFMFEVSEYGKAIEEFDEQLWMMVIDCVIVYPDGRLGFKFRNGVEIER